MVLYDMLRNATGVSLEDIARRQQLIGYDYDVLHPADPGSWGTTELHSSAPSTITRVPVPAAARSFGVSG